MAETPHSSETEITASPQEAPEALDPSSLASAAGAPETAAAELPAVKSYATKSYAAKSYAAKAAEEVDVQVVAIDAAVEAEAQAEVAFAADGPPLAAAPALTAEVVLAELAAELAAELPPQTAAEPELPAVAAAAAEPVTAAAAPLPAVAAPAVKAAESGASVPAPAPAPPRDGIASTLTVPPLESGEAGEGGEWDLLVGKVRAWFDGADLQARWEALGGPLRAVGLLLAAVVLLRLYTGLLSTLGELPLLPRLLQLVGLVAVLRFALTRLVRSQERQRILGAWRERWNDFRGRD